MCGAQSPWKTLFETWPAEMAKRGVVITLLNEQIPFNGFMIGEHFVLISRNAPDAIGARTVLIPFESIALLKFTDVIKGEVFKMIGFRGELGRQ